MFKVIIASNGEEEAVRLLGKGAVGAFEARVGKRELLIGVGVDGQHHGGQDSTSRVLGKTPRKRQGRSPVIASGQNSTDVACRRRCRS